MSRQTQLRIAHETARIMTEDHVSSMAVAKQKAMQRLGIQNRRLGPDNNEIETALKEYQQLFGGRDHSRTLNEYRQIALHAMKMLEDFSPRLVGPVLKGTASPNDCVALHVFTDTPEEIHFLLADNKIPFETDDYKYKQTKGQTISCPACRFFAGEIEVSVAIFSVNGMRQPPLSPLDDKPMQRANRASVEKLIAKIE